MKHGSPFLTKTFATAVAIFCTYAPFAAALELVEAIKKAERSAVRVDTDRAHGSGVIIDDRGLVLTNFHLIEGARRAKITLRTGVSCEVRGYVAAEPGRDLAILKVDPFREPLALAMVAQVPAVGEKVAALGSPQGLSVSTSDGIVAAVRKGEELNRTIGGLYQTLGYDCAATWLQTTTPISGGNCGGPLVNLNAELVGINTWNRTDGQSLNFAISSSDIREVVEKADIAALRDFAALPTVSKRSTIKDSGEFLVPFPSGRVFSFAVFRDSSSMATMNTSTLGTVAIKHTNGSIYALAHQTGGKLNGLALAQYDNGRPMTYAMYADGRRHGVVKTWNEAGEPVILAQYAKGKRHGFLCFFDEEPIWILAEYKFDEIQSMQLMSRAHAMEGFRSRAEADKNPHCTSVLARLDAVDKSLKTNEAAFRNQVGADEERKRRSMSARAVPEKRRNQNARAGQRTNEEEVFIRQMLQSNGFR